MKKKYTNTNVYQATQNRLKFIFDEFEAIEIAFSGGKDSGVMLNLALDYKKKHNLPHKIGVFHLDYEAQYTATTEYVDSIYEQYEGEIENLRCCVPVRCATSTSMFESYWRPWEESKRDIWVRDMPSRCLTLQDLPFVTDGMTDYEFQEKISLWYSEKTGLKTAVLIGIRADESLDRFRAIISDRNINKYKGKNWSKVMNDRISNFYPIYDWSTQDIWVAYAKFGWSYNKLYDLFYYAGVSIHDMRVASPFHDAAKSSLALYRVLDPNVWGKMVSRVNGVNFTALYGGTKAMGWRNVSKPSHFTWKQYAMFLLETLPQEMADSYRAKLETSIRFWRNRGGVLSQEAIDDLCDAGMKFEVGDKTNYKTPKRPVRMEYIDEIESREFSLIPTWKRLCITILKNDHVGKYMGFSQTKAESAKRKKALKKYKNL